MPGGGPPGAPARIGRKGRTGQNVPNIMRQKPGVPWLYLLPALVVMTFFIVYPMITTIGLSFLNANGTGPVSAACAAGRSCWGPFENYHYALSAEIDFTNFGRAWTTFWYSSYGNMIKWALLMVSGTVILGLLIAVLTDRVRYEPLAKAIIFMPMAISFVGAGIIWGFVYNYGTSSVQIGILNAIITALGGQPVAWLQTVGINTIALIVVGIWIWTGFSMTILSASLKSVPSEILEAARVDGANEWQVFSGIMVPIIMPTITVVITTMVINTLKLFDIVYVMTGGNYKTDVIAVRMYREYYINYNQGHATAVAVVLIILILPFIYYNIKRFLEQEASR